MSEVSVIKDDTDVVGAIVESVVADTILNIRAFCGTRAVTETVIASDETFSVRAIGDSKNPDELVVTYVSEDEDVKSQERFTFSLDPPALVGSSHHDWSRLEELDDRLIELNLSQGDPAEIRAASEERAAFKAETADGYVPHNDVEDDSVLYFCEALAEIAHRALQARKIQAAEAYHAQKAS